MERMDGEMKTKARRIRIALIAMMISLAMTMSAFACDDYDDLWGYDAYEGPEAYDDYWYDECDWEDEDEYAYMYEDGYWDDFENWLDTDDYEAGGRVLSYEDLSEDAVIDNDVFEFMVLPETVGSNDATISAFVRNPYGKTVTAAGCTLYYTFGGVAKSVMVGCDCDYDEFNMQFVLSDILDQELDHGCVYNYRFFIEADGVLYTHDLDHFETNMSDGLFEVMHELCSATSGSVSVDVTVYNWEEMPVEEVGCKLGEYSFELDRDMVTGDFSDTLIYEDFTLNFPDGKYVSGKKYTYEVYVVSNGKTYIVGRDDFTIY